jgi:dihydroxyacid dehydratase/phosphogluconate dehydratase
MIMAPGEFTRWFQGTEARYEYQDEAYRLVDVFHPPYPGLWVLVIRNKGPQGTNGVVDMILKAS